MAKSKELTLRDKRLLKAAANGWSGEEIEEKYGIPAAQALWQIREMLKARDIFTDIERKQLLLFSLYDLKEKFETESLDLDDPRSVDAYTKVIKTISETLEKQGQITEAEMQAAAQAQAKALLQLIDAAYGRVRDWLAEEYGNVPIDVMDERFNEAMREIASEEDE